MTRAWNGPTQAARAAAPPQAIMSQNTLFWCSIRRTSSSGTSPTVQTVSLMNALLPWPSAKNEYRQLSCTSRPGRIRPRARKAGRGPPCRAAAAASAAVPAISPTTRAVPVVRAVTRRQAAGLTPLNLTSIGSVARPREAVSMNE